MREKQKTTNSRTCHYTTFKDLHGRGGGGDGGGTVDTFSLMDYNLNIKYEVFV